MKRLFPWRACRSNNRIGAVVGCVALLLPMLAFAELMIYPTRLVVEGNQRATKVELINNSNQKATYRITLVNRRMDEFGAFSEVDVARPDEQFAIDMLRYSPRQVTLPPGAGQTVRIMVRKPAGLAVGEYRSHLMFSRQPDVDGMQHSNTGSDTDGVGVKVRTLVGATIPVIVRHGATEAKVQLEDLELGIQGDRAILGFTIERDGSRSVYGDILATFIPEQGPPVVAGRANGVAVYTPNAKRAASILLDQLDVNEIRHGTLRLVYKEQAEDGARVLAERLLKVP
ncbi:fimbrial biogenesis chaperone [Marinobacter orientalis]|uniref:Molecular chaperone n=1 Tax=Marinobacter orientalis TaxID=1928859 RepID=A0A7Y0NL07_9GAMM|nr:molecular chaperone [Marinobacter orientalis]NMT62959.1 molecular chaperone [Marinobacter orientalis]TGX51625.1 molecular chaperone [Marinobacter orientalis]